MTTLRNVLRASLVAPLALAIAACGSEGDVEGLNGDPIAPIAAPEGGSWLDTVSVTESDGYIVGNPDAPIKLIKYGSLTCGACAQFALQSSGSLKEDYVESGRVSFELRNQIHNAIDLTMARLVRCSAPSSYHPLSDQVWKNLQTLLSPDRANDAVLRQAMSLAPEERYVALAQNIGLLEFFSERGVSVDQAVTCLSDPASVDAIGTRSDEQSRELNVTSTPTFFLNGQKLEERSWPEIEQVLQRAGARSE